jgi:hypothetical protein
MSNSDDCEPARPYRARTECIERKGFALSIQYPADCKMAVVERRPAPLNLQRRWDGTVEGSYLLGREVSFDLTSLREDMITTSPYVELDFQVTRAKVPIVRALVSDKREQWIPVPAPPLKEDFPTDFPNPAARDRAFQQAVAGLAPKNAPVFPLSERAGRLRAVARIPEAHDALNGSALVFLI